MKRPGIFAKVMFMDVIFNMLVGVLAIVMLLKVEPPAEKRKEESLETDGLYAIVATWPKEADDDVDLYVQDPSGNLIYFGRTAVELMHLEYDDRGTLGDRAMTSSGEVKVDINRERAVIRGGMAGEYVVNVHMYTKRHASPTTVKISLYRLRGDDTEILAKERTLKSDQDEATAFRFTLTAGGEMTGSNELSISLTGGASTGAGPVPQQGGMSFPGGSVP